MAEERKSTAAKGAAAAAPAMPHNVVLEDRRLLTVSGVADVDSFDEHTVTVFTDMGELTVRGDDLHINRLSVEVGELLLEGKIAALIYQEETPRSGGGFLKKVFR
ncbi:MAG: sporulation protein YabP [Oscillospiraceae bacterium]|nr:sporulation protein YabP [Oscillospiraceae bacterium]